MCLYFVKYYIIRNITTFIPIKVWLLYAAEDLYGMERNYKIKHELRRKLKRISLYFFEESLEPLQVSYTWIVFAFIAWCQANVTYR